MWVSQRGSLDSPWGTPQNLGPNINTSANEQCAHLPPDGHTLLFASNRSGGVGGDDLYVARRRNQRDNFSWDIPENLGGGVNSASTDFTPGYMEDENGTITLYFMSNRPGGPGGSDIYASVMGNDGTFGPAVSVPELNSSASELFPTPRRDGLELFLSSNRTGTLGGQDLWVSTRASTADPWSTPANLGPLVNSGSNELGGGLSFSRTSLFFHSNRPLGEGGVDLYEITRDKLTGQNK